MKKLLTYLSKTFATQLAREAAIAIVLGLLLVGWLWFHPGPKPVVTHPNATTTNVVVQKGAITPKEVVKYVQDDAEVKKLLAENAKLKQQVTQLTEVLAVSHSSGGGKVTKVPVASVPANLRPAASAPTAEPPQTSTATPAAQQPTEAPATSALDFSDWRLHFVIAGTQAKYDLTQKFEVISTTGRDKNGKPVSTTKLFEVGPGDARTEIKDTKTTNVFTDATRPSWHVGITVQAGLGYAVQSADTSKTGAAAVVGVQWLKHGRTNAAEDSTYSLLTPVALWADSALEFGVLPVSLNLGRIPHQPFKDMWVSPYLGFGKDAKTKSTTLGHLAVVLTASF